MGAKYIAKSRTRIRHHSVELKHIVNLVYRARRLFLQGYKHEALRCLGRALHYVQDALIPIDMHSLEHYIDRLLRYRIRDVDTKSIPFELRSDIETVLSSNLKPCTSAQECIDRAIRISLFIARAVLMPREPPRELLSDIDELRHRLKLLQEYRDYEHRLQMIRREIEALRSKLNELNKKILEKKFRFRDKILCILHLEPNVARCFEKTMSRLNKRLSRLYRDYTELQSKTIEIRKALDTNLPSSLETLDHMIRDIREHLNKLERFVRRWFYL